MSCPDATVVQAFVEGALGKAERAAVEHHVDSCSICRRLVGAIMETHSDTVTPPTVDERPPRATPRPALALGTTVGRYKITGYLGKGGMGIVYAAHDPELRRDIALKVLRPDRTRDLGDSQARLAREAQAMARIAHPNVIGVHDVGAWQGEVFVAMELATAGTLRGWCQQRPVDEIIGAYVQAGRGLAAAHAAGLVHRDFKPDNVLVGSDGRMRVTDFGLARTHDALVPDSVPPVPSALPIGGTTATGTVMGTPGYIAPELYGGEPSDARTDQFAFCVALWEALYRQRPFSGASETELVVAIRAGAVREPADTHGVASAVQRALRRGLDPDPQRRWPTMSVLLAALEPKPRRARWPVLGGVVGAAVVGAIAFVAWPAAGRDDKPVRQVTRAQVGAAQAAADLMGKALVHWAQGDRAAARREATASVARARDAGSPEMLANALQSLAYMFEANGELHAAEENLLEAIELTESIGAEALRSKGVIKLVEILELEGKKDDAKRWQKMINGTAARPATDDETRANALESLADSLTDVGQSIAKYNEALAYRDRGGTLEDRATNRTAAASKLYGVARYGEARTMLLDSLAVIERRGHDAFEVTVATAATYDQLGMVDLGREDWRAAEADCDRAASLWLANGGPQSPMLRSTYQNLGSALAHQSKLVEARNAFARAIELSGTDPAALASAHAWIAMALHDDDSARDEAAHEGALAVELATRAFGADHPDVLAYRVFLAKLYGTARDSAHAIPLAEQLIAELEKRGDDPLALADVRFVLARALPPAHRDRARSLAQQARAAYVTAGTVRAPHLARLDHWLANPDASN